jgi:hypothetical protein
MTTTYGVLYPGPGLEQKHTCGDAFLWTRAIKRFALFDLLKSLYSDTKILSKYIPFAEKIISDAFSYSENV